MLAVFKGVKNGSTQAQRETPVGAVFDTREACEVKTYRDEHRLESKYSMSASLVGYE